MLEILRHKQKVRKLQRQFDKVSLKFAVKTELARRNENSDEIDRLKTQRILEQIQHQNEIDLEISSYLVSEAYDLLLPIPLDDEYWERPETGPDFLNREGAKKVREDIRAEKKANWEFWQSRAAFALGLIGSIFGILAYFKK